MSLRPALSAALLGLVLVGAPVLGGCGGPRAQLYAPTTVVGQTVLVRVKTAYVRGDRVVVKTFMKNTTDGPITIDRDGIALRMPDGRLVPRGSGRTTRHEPYELAAGEGRDVHVDFRLDTSDVELSDVALVLGGVTLDGELEPRVVGEIPLSSELHLAGVSSRAPAATEVEPGGDEVDGATDGAEPAEEPEEEWEIGGAG